MIPILQPFVPHYRKTFFESLKRQFGVEVYCYENLERMSKANFSFSDFSSKRVRSVSYKGVLLYSPMPFLKSEKMVLMLNVAHITTWFLLFTKFAHRKKITLWGHGISVKRYLREEKRPSVLMSIMIRLADKVWFYTEKEKEIWAAKFPNSDFYSLNNTVSNVDEILSQTRIEDRQVVKEKYNIKEDVCLIYCARFETEHRKAELLVDLARKIPDYALIIIGDGRHKPSFDGLKNVYDFGAVYDSSVKNELFSVADIYFQPAWVGLSIVEAMAYSLPILTLQRSENTLQCVEYAYLDDGVNAMICESIDEAVRRLMILSSDELTEMQIKAKRYVLEELSMDHMINTAGSSLTSTVGA